MRAGDHRPGHRQRAFLPRPPRTAYGTPLEVGSPTSWTPWGCFPTYFLPRKLPSAENPCSRLPAAIWPVRADTNGHVTAMSYYDGDTLKQRIAHGPRLLFPMYKGTYERRLEHGAE